MNPLIHCATIHPQFTKDAANHARLIGKGVKYVKTKAEELGIMYCAFCPYHSHTFHTEPCKKWMQKVDMRKALTARVKAQGEQKNAARSNKYQAAASSTMSDARF